MPKISVITPSIRPEGLIVVQECLGSQTFTDFEWLTEIGLGKEHDLNKAFNRMLLRAKGELVVFYQDYIKIENDGLQKFWEAYQKNKDTFFTAPVGKTKNWKDVEWDWREAGGDAAWNRWEIDWAAAPLWALIEIGGFDEALDEFWSFDNVNTGFRASLSGYKFTNLSDNKAIAYDHDAYQPHPFRKAYNPMFHSQRLRDIEMGNVVIKPLK